MHRPVALSSWWSFVQSTCRRIDRVRPRLRRGIGLQIALIVVVLAGCTIAAHAQCSLTSTPSAATQVDVSYSQANTASGCTAPVSFAVAGGTLPTGTLLDAATGTVSGTPTSPGSFNYTIRVTDAGSATTQASSSGTIAPALAISASPAAVTEVGLAYSQANPVSGGTGPFAYALASGSLPAGTSLDPSTGTVSGTPTSSGGFSYAIRVTDAVGATAQASSSGTIAPALSIAATPSASTEVGVSYSQANTVSGGTGPYTYALASGSLPAGTLLNTSNGTVFGIPTTQGPFSYSILVTDAFGATALAASNGLITQAALALGSTPSAAAQVGVAYSQANTASGGTAPYVYSLASGSLPAGTTLDTSTGTVSGTPTSSGAFSYSIRVTDAATATAQASSSGSIAAALTLTAAPSALTQVGQSYSQTNTASNGTAPYVYSLASGSLPAGTSLNTSNGTVSGTPTIPGPFSYAIRVADSNAATALSSSSGTLAPGPLSITATASATAQVGQAYSQANVASGGTAPYSYSLASGSLPAGTSLDTSTGTVSGTPTAQGPFSYSIKVTDAAAAFAQASSSGTIAASVTTTSVSSSVNPSVPGQPVKFTATVSGGSAPSGTVTFSDGGTPIGTAALAGTSATFTTSSLSLGSHAIIATYNGNANNAASSSAVLQQSVAVPADSIRLRQMQILGAQQSAQLSGQNISGAVGNAIDNAFSGHVPAVTPNGSGFTYNFVPGEAAGAQAGGSAADRSVKEFVAAPDRNASQMGRARLLRARLCRHQQGCAKGAAAGLAGVDRRARHQLQQPDARHGPPRQPAQCHGRRHPQTGQ